MKRMVFSKVSAHFLFGAIGFVILTSAFSLDALIMLLNGGFGGALAALLIAFGPLLYNTARNIEPYSRARQMTLGWFALWLAYVLVAYVSVWTRSIGEPTLNPSYASALSRYIAIYGAILQVSAPDFGLGLLYGRDRKVLWTALVVGLVVGFAVWIAQDQALLSDLAIFEYFSTARHAESPLRRGFGAVWIGVA